MLNSTEIFEPLTDDKFAVPAPLIEVATVKPSGYLQPRAVVPESFIPDVVASINTYYTAQDRELPAVYFRYVGSIGWLKLDSITLDVPDELPADFS